MWPSRQQYDVIWTGQMWKVAKAYWRRESKDKRGPSEMVRGRSPGGESFLPPRRQ